MRILGRRPHREEFLDGLIEGLGLQSEVSAVGSDPRLQKLEEENTQLQSRIQAMSAAEQSSNNASSASGLKPSGLAVELQSVFSLQSSVQSQGLHPDIFSLTPNEALPLTQGRAASLGPPQLSI